MNGNHLQDENGTPDAASEALESLVLESVKRPKVVSEISPEPEATSAITSQGGFWNEAAPKQDVGRVRTDGILAVFVVENWKTKSMKKYVGFSMKSKDSGGFSTILLYCSC